MGIPKLSQDVAPYAETAILGELPEHVTAVEVKRLLIDGPSMVYHVYNALARAQSIEIDAVDTPPTYHQINNCCEQFLNDLEASGAIILKIFFDGALPVRKRPTRQDRLEKIRQQLENFRRTYARCPPFALAQPFTKQGSSVPKHPEALKKILWKCSSIVGSKKQLLPPPPFMVASVIESLRRSKWSEITTIVPGEADEFCAAEATQSDGAILSNDSDLLLYQMGPGAVIVVLHSLQPMIANEHFTSCRLKAQCLKPAEVARRLGVPSMLDFAFQRFLDIGPRTAVIAQRARENRPDKNNSTWMDFRDEYQSLATVSLQRSAKILQTLDPRIAELMCSFTKDETLHLYFPMVLEDPSRDTAWSYGLHIRQLAYTVLFRHWNRKHRNSHQSQVTEYSRRGARIGDNNVSSLSGESFQQHLRTLSALVGICCPQICRIASSGARDASNSQSRSIDFLVKSDTVLNLHLLAACVVISQRPQKADMHKASCLRLFASTSFGAAAGARRHKLTWDDLHFFAALHCTLYSLRLFKQVTGYVEADGYVELRYDANGANLLSFVDNMPEIAETFVEVTSLRDARLCCSKEHIENLLEIIEKHNKSVRRLSQHTLADSATASSSYAHEIEDSVRVRILDASREERDVSKECDVSKRPGAGRSTAVGRKTKRIQDRLKVQMQATQQAKLSIDNPFTVLGQD